MLWIERFFEFHNCLNFIILLFFLHWTLLFLWFIWKSLCFCLLYLILCSSNLQFYYFGTSGIIWLVPKPIKIHILGYILKSGYIQNALPTCDWFYINNGYIWVDVVSFFWCLTRLLSFKSIVYVIYFTDLFWTVLLPWILPLWKQNHARNLASTN